MKDELFSRSRPSLRHECKSGRPTKLMDLKKVQFTDGNIAGVRLRAVGPSDRLLDGDLVQWREEDRQCWGLVKEAGQASALIESMHHVEVMLYAASNFIRGFSMEALSSEDSVNKLRAALIVANSAINSLVEEINETGCELGQVECVTGPMKDVAKVIGEAFGSGVKSEEFKEAKQQLVRGLGNANN